MEPAIPTPPAPTKPAICANCGYSIAAELPAKCPECGFQVVEHTPTWSDRPMSWPARLLMIGWPLIGIAIGMLFVNFGGPIDNIAPFVTIFCFLIAFINAPAMGLITAERPPAFIEGEPPERSRRRRRITHLITFGLAVMIPVLLFGSCLYSILPPH